jgi:hypothetical protein
MTTEDFAPLARTFLLEILALESIGPLPSLLISILKLPAATSIVAGSKMPSFATSLYAAYPRRCGHRNEGEKGGNAMRI